MQFVGEQRLHRRRAAFQSEILAIQTVFLENLFLVRGPGDRVNGGRETAAGDTELLLSAADGRQDDRKRKQNNPDDSHSSLPVRRAQPAGAIRPPSQQPECHPTPQISELITARA
jgi:hypothetical protein